MSMSLQYLFIKIDCFFVRAFVQLLTPSLSKIFLASAKEPFGYAFGAKHGAVIFCDSLKQYPARQFQFPFPSLFLRFR